MEIVKIGGPIYRIGVGGGAASSIQVQGDNDAHLDLGAVQRGDAEMEQKMNRLLRACIEMRERNPICSIHDQGAGGNGQYFHNETHLYMKLGNLFTVFILSVKSVLLVSYMFQHFNS